MENFRRGNRFGGGGRDSGRTTMHKAVCAKCGQDCEVPFRPTGNKPVFCSECFKSEGDNEQRKFGGRDSRRSNFSDKKMYEAICTECGKDCEVPFRPTGDKPVYCSECFSKGSKGKGSGQSTKQFDSINTKLDKILELLAPAVTVTTKEKKKVVDPKKTKATTKKKKVVDPKKTKATTKKKKVVAPKKKKATTKKKK